MQSNSSMINQSSKSRTSGEGTSCGEVPSPTLDQLRTFLHLTTQAPLETVCRASLHVLTHVPGSRQAVLEYLATFYKVATFLHLRYNITLKNASAADLANEAANLVQINQAIEMIESALEEMLNKSTYDNELWSLELTRWLADMIGDTVSNTATTCVESMPGLTPEEIASFRVNISNHSQIFINITFKYF